MSEVTILPPVRTVEINTGPKTADERIALQQSIKGFFDQFHAANPEYELAVEGPVIEGAVKPSGKNNAE